MAAPSKDGAACLYLECRARRERIRDTPPAKVGFGFVLNGPLILIKQQRIVS
jgi:hypothetical protein